MNPLDQILAPLVTEHQRHLQDAAAAAENAAAQADQVLLGLGAVLRASKVRVGPMDEAQCWARPTAQAVQWLIEEDGTPFCLVEVAAHGAPIAQASVTISTLQGHTVQVLAPPDAAGAEVNPWRLQQALVRIRQERAAAWAAAATPGVASAPGVPGTPGGFPALRL